MPRYCIDYAITGRAWVYVEAESLEEAKQLSKSHAHKDPPGGQVEWAYEDVNSVTEVKGG